MSHNKKRVLIVDDDEGIRDSMEIALGARGYEVLLAHDGNEGLARAERDAPDLVILDVVMPRRSGFNVLKRLNMMPTLNPRVIMVTGNEDPRHRIYAEASGVDAYVQKPFDVDSVLDLVDGLLD